MKNKRNVAKALIVATTMTNIPVDSLANTIDEYKIEENSIENNIKKIFSRIFGPINNQRSNQKEVVKVNRNIVEGKILEITLGNDDFISDLSGNPEGYETVKVVTTDDKKLESTDFANLKSSGIPKIDLSGAKADSIPERAFINARHLTDFKFPEGIISIDSSAFSGCGGLTGNLVIPDSVTTIGANAFNNCSGFTGELVIPNSVTSIGNNAFYSCTGFNGTLTIGSSVITIGDSAFRYCRGFTGDLVIPDSVVTIEESAFNNCSGFTGDLTIGNSVTTIEYGAFNNCTGFKGSIIIGDSVEIIDDFAFNECNGFTGTLTLGNSVKTIGIAAFQSCNRLTGNLIIPDSVTTLGSHAFYQCYGMRGNLVLGNSLTEIGPRAFDSNEFSGNLVLPDSLEIIGDYAFNMCGFRGDLVIPDSVTTIGKLAFRYCDFNGILKIGNSVTTIGNDAFYSTKFTGDLIIPDSVTTIGNNAFEWCTGFTGTLKIGRSVTTIGDKAFYNSGITGKVIISDSIEAIGASAFENCANLEQIITKIDESNINSIEKRNIVESLPIDKMYIEISPDLDISGTWLEEMNLTIMTKPILSAYGGNFENNEGMGVILKNMTSPIKAISITKDGLDYSLEANKYGDYIFKESGDYNISMETELGTIYNLSFRNNTPILDPSLEINDKIVNIIDNGVLCNNPSEEFDNPNELKFNFSNPNWTMEDGILKSESIGNNSRTTNEFTVNAKAGDKLQIKVNTSSESSYDWGYVYLNENEVYKKSGTSNKFEILELDLQKGENIIKFIYAKDSSQFKGDDAMFIDSIKLLSAEASKMSYDTLEYRINNGDWQAYADAFELDYPDGEKVKIEVRAKYDGFVNILTKEFVIGGDEARIQAAISLAEQSKEPLDIANARSLVNTMPESETKNKLQARLNDIIPNTTFNPKDATANLDVYIKSENMLSLSLDTNTVTFDDFGGTENLEKENAVNLTVNSSLPYKVDAYLASEIQNAAKDKTMNKEILNIKANDTDEYKTFKDIGITPITLLDAQEAGKDKAHSIDIMLKGGITYEKDAYKTTLRFEITQK